MSLTKKSITFFDKLNLSSLDHLKASVLVNIQNLNNLDNKIIVVFKGKINYELDILKNKRFFKNKKNCLFTFE